MHTNILDYIGENDDLQLIIRFHLLIESYVIKLIELNLEEPSYFAVDKISFPQKVGLAISLGAIESDFKGILLKINRIRNKFAHDINTRVLDSDIQELHSLIHQKFKAALNATPFHNQNNTGKLGGIFMCVVAYLMECCENCA